MPVLEDTPAFISIDHPAFSIRHETGVDYATWYIRTKAEQLAGQYGFAKDEDEDLRQEFVLRLFQLWPGFDPAVSKATTFIQNVIDNMVCDLVREQVCQKQDYLQNRPISHSAEYGKLDAVRGQPEVSPQERFEIQADCAQILASLPDDLRTITELLQEMSPAAAVRELGIPESTFRFRLRELREHFIAAGYGDFLDSTDFEDEEHE